MNANSSTSSQEPVDTGAIAPASQSHHLHLVHDEKCASQPALTHSSEPTGSDILAAAGRPGNADQIVLQVLREGGLESIRLDERANLALGNKFVLAVGDRTFRFAVNAKQYEWPFRLISGAMVLELAAAGHEHDVELTRQGVKTLVAPDELVDLSQAGVEQFTTVKHVWTLIVGGVALKYDIPLVKAADAMTRAGFDTTKAWHIFLIVHGHDKKEISLDTIVDLRTPGIEKIRLTPRNVGNGDGQPQALRREFKLLPADTEYLDSLTLRWELVSEAERRWLLIHDYQLPAGYAPRTTLLALDIPKDYPASQIDMFYFAPFVSLANAAEIPSTQVRATIGGVTFQGWSRHRAEPHLWDPSTDSVRTHMALVEGCLAKELGQ
jgi:hypothetical protein